MVGTKVDVGYVLLTVRHPALMVSTDTTEWCLDTDQTELHATSPHRSIISFVAGRMWLCFKELSSVQSQD